MELFNNLLVDLGALDKNFNIISRKRISLDDERSGDFRMLTPPHFHWPKERCSACEINTFFPGCDTWVTLCNECVIALFESQGRTKPVSLQPITKITRHQFEEELVCSECNTMFPSNSNMEMFVFDFKRKKI